MPGPAEVDPDADIERALSYVQQVKNRYANDPEKYKAFLEILSPGEIAGVRQPIVVSYVFLLISWTGECLVTCRKVVQG
jgi:hypothetical protein